MGTGRAEETNVKDLTATIIAADNLVDYNFAAGYSDKGENTQGTKEKGQLRPKARRKSRTETKAKPKLVVGKQKSR